MSELNLHQKLVEVRKTIDVFTKDTDGYKYRYVSGSQVLHKIKNKLDELGLLLIPSVDSQDWEKVNNEFVVSGSMKYTWINAENPEQTLSIPWKIYGQKDDISKAFGSSLTYSERYFLLKFFSVPTDDEDPDANQKPANKPQEQRRSNAKPASEKQLTLVNKLLQKKVTEQYPYNVLHENLKKKVGTQNNIENFTSQEASKAIEILQGKEKQAG